MDFAGTGAVVTGGGNGVIASGEPASVSRAGAGGLLFVALPSRSTISPIATSTGIRAMPFAWFTHP